MNFGNKMNLYVFGSLPQTKSCCKCVSLKIGCIAIAVVYLLFIVEAFSGCSANKEYTKCFFTGMLMQIVGWIAGAVCLITLIATLVFLYGIAKSKPATYVFFMYTTIMLIIFNMATSLIMLFLSHRDCTMPYLFGGANFLGAILLIYFLIVVNSYYRKEVAETAVNNTTNDTTNNTANTANTANTTNTTNTTTTPTAT